MTIQDFLHRLETLTELDQTQINTLRELVTDLTDQERETTYSDLFIINQELVNNAVQLRKNDKELSILAQVVTRDFPRDLRKAKEQANRHAEQLPTFNF